VLKIKLQPLGKRNAVKYRIVVMEENSKLTGTVVENLGSSLDAARDKISAWQSKGAQVTAGLRKLLQA